MPYSSYYKNKCLDVIRGGGNGVTFTAPTTVYASAHTASPGDSGTNEVTGGSPAYARQSITYSAASAGAQDSSNTPVLDVPASTTVTHLGLWDASTSGNFIGYADVTDEAFGAQGTYTITDWDNDLNS